MSYYNRTGSQGPQQGLTKFCHAQVTFNGALRIRQSQLGGCCMPTTIFLNGRLTKECICHDSIIKPDFAFFGGGLQPPVVNTNGCDDIVFAGFGFRSTKMIGLCGALTPTDDPTVYLPCNSPKVVTPWSAIIDIPNDVLSDPNRPFRRIRDCGAPPDGRIDGRPCECIPIPGAATDPDPVTGEYCESCQMTLETYRCLMAHELCPSPAGQGPNRRKKIAEEVIYHKLQDLIGTEYPSCS